VLYFEFVLPSEVSQPSRLSALRQSDLKHLFQGGTAWIVGTIDGAHKLYPMIRICVRREVADRLGNDFAKPEAVLGCQVFHARNESEIAEAQDRFYSESFVVHFVEQCAE
jgi:hypothetical protein